jgi:hypothetical protein
MVEGEMDELLEEPPSKLIKTEKGKKIGRPSKFGEGAEGSAFAPHHHKFHATIEEAVKLGYTADVSITFNVPKKYKAGVKAIEPLEFEVSRDAQGANWLKQMYNVLLPMEKEELQKSVEVSTTSLKKKQAAAKLAAEKEAEEEEAAEKKQRREVAKAVLETYEK